MVKKRLLINYVYYTPVGHVLEALKFAEGFYRNNRNLEISIVMSSSSPFLLAEGCRAVKRIYLVDLEDLLKNGEKSKDIAKIPRNWDYIITNDIIRHEISGKPGWMEEAFSKYLDIADKRFKARIATGTCYYNNKFPKQLRYRKCKLRLKVPQSSKLFVERYRSKGVKICILPAGSAGHAYYPSTDSWIKIISRLNSNFKDCRIYITGSKKVAKHGGTNTMAFGSADIDKILNKFNNVTDCFDIGLRNEVSLIEMCDVLIAPHSGFAFLASCVNTPWLAISGGDWSEYFFNHYPFYSVLPNDREFPYEGIGEYTKHGGKKWHTKSQKRIPPFTAKSIEKKLPEIIEGTRLLLDPSFTYRRRFRDTKRILQNQYVKRIS